MSNKMVDMPEKIGAGWREQRGEPDNWSGCDDGRTEYLRADLTGLQCFYDYDGELPNKLMALYSDGSGCEMYFKKGVNWYPVKDPEDCFGGVDKDWFVDADYLWFIALPDDFKVWVEDG